jgi:hypothetical protein
MQNHGSNVFCFFCRLTAIHACETLVKPLAAKH